MCSQIVTPAKTFINICRKLLVISLAAVLFFSCKKDINQPATRSVSQSLSFHVSTSRIVMLPGNANSTALKLSWEGGVNTPGINYTIEAAIRGTAFEEPVTIGATDQSSVSFMVKDFNRQMLKLIIPGKEAMIDLRIKSENTFSKEAVYSETIALAVTPYQQYKEYDNTRIMRIPGNYQAWKLDCAPQLVAPSQAGEYEGFINFTNQYAQFLMVKGTTEWDPRVTYNYIGANKLGFGGSVFSIFGGAGAYQLKVNMNTNTWAYTKISNWGLNGSAVSNDGNADQALQADATGLSWSITTSLSKGSFRFRANKNNNIMFGHNISQEPGVPDYNGENIQVSKAGNYTITLNLSQAGNYSYGIQRNS